MLVLAFNPYSERRGTEEEVEKIAQLSPQYNIYNHTDNPLLVSQM